MSFENPLFVVLVLLVCVRVLFSIILITIAMSYRNTIHSSTTISLYWGISHLLYALSGIAFLIKKEVDMILLIAQALIVALALYFKLVSLPILYFSSTSKFGSWLNSNFSRIRLIGIVIFAVLAVSSLIIMSTANLNTDNATLFFYLVNGTVSYVLNSVFLLVLLLSFYSLVENKGVKVLAFGLIFVYLVLYTLFSISYIKHVYFNTIEVQIIFNILSLFIFIFIQVLYLNHYILEKKSTSNWNINLHENHQDNKIDRITSLQLIYYEGKYKIQLGVLFENGETIISQVESPKNIKPVNYWITFALAKKHQIQLSHSDISIIKFRIVEFWNKFSKIQITQSLLFEGSRGKYHFVFSKENILIEGLSNIKDNYSINQTLLEFEHNWLDSGFISQKTKDNYKRKPDRESLIAQIIEL